MVSKAIQLLQSASKSGVSIFLTNGQLQVKFTKGSGIDPTLLDEIKANKELLTDFLNNSDFKTAKVESYEAELLTINRNDYPSLPLSYSQERLWFIDKLEGSVQYHIPAVLRIKGILNKVALGQSFQAVVERHQVLRTVILEDNGQAYQHIKQNTWQLRQSDGGHFAGDASGLQQYISACISAPFNLNSDDMLRAELIVLSALEHVLVVTLHHIASDGWSFSILVGEVVESYNAFVQERTARLTPLAIQYADYALWQRHYLVGEVLANKVSYWKNKLDNVSPLQLPTDYNRPPVQSSRGAVVNFSVNKEVTSALQALALQQGSTLFMTLLSAFKVLVYRYSGQQDICVGTPIAGRQQQEVEGLIGFFINTLALRTLLNPQESFTALLQQVKATTLQAYDHQEVPFEKVVEQVIKERDLSRSPLFQIMFVLQNTPETEGLSLAGASLQAEALGHTTAKFDISFTLRETPQGLRGSIEYCTDLYKADSIERMSSHYHELLQSIVQHADWAVSALPMLSSGEEKQLLYHFNNTAAAYPTNQSITGLFEVQASRTPHAVALVFGEETLSYGQLNNRANQLAHYLQSQGVTKETLVPICLERNIDMIVGLLGILKAGGAYVPIDPEYPAERIAFMLRDTAATMVLSSSQAKATLPRIEGLRVIEIDQPNEQINKQPATNLQTHIHPQQLAYVIYTSGSTGKPKGVMVEHGSVVNLVTSPNYVSLSGNDVLLATGSFSFDATTFEYWSMLLHGGQLVMCSENTLLNANLLKAVITDKAVSLMWFTSSWFNQLVETNINVFEGLKTILVGGEKLSEYHIDKVIKIYPGLKLVNGYGPTENTTFSLTYDISNWQPATIIPIGNPLQNRTAYITDSQMRLLPIGIPGEICLGGAGLSRGYLNNETLTKEKFVANPFAVNANERLYKTGDIGRWLPDGNIEYLGRKDEQVKIRGYRIELGEIENVLLQSGLVSQAVVAAKTDQNGNKRLVGYVVAEDGFDKEATLAFLENKLPHYMVPALWVQLEKIPLTSNGKVDRRGLPEVDTSGLAKGDYIAPESDLEKCLAGIWQDLLGIERIGLHDNFFELGGDSITTIQVVSRLSRQGYAAQPKDVFLHQSIGRLSAAIADRSLQATSAEQGVLSGNSGLLPIQQWYLQKDPFTVSHFNQSVLLSVDKKITAHVLRQVADRLTAHHDALRFTYNKKDGHWQQAYGSQPAVVLLSDLKEVAAGTLAATITAQANEGQRSLNITKGEVVKLVLMETPATEIYNRLLIIIHHLVVDGVSWRIILEDLELLLNNTLNGHETSLGNKTSSYRQWYNALQEYGRSNRVLSQQQYWKKIADNYEPLPVDFAESSILKVKNIAYHSVRLTKDSTLKLLQEVPRVYRTEINDILLSALAKTLIQWSKKQSVVIGLEGHGREDISDDTDISRTVGWFTNLYPVNVMVDVVDDDSLIKSVKEQLRLIPDRGIGYGVLKYINHHETLQGREPWDIIFNYLGQFDNVISKSKWVTASSESSGANMAGDQQVTQLSIGSFVQAGELVISWNYSKAHYRQQTVETLASAFLSNLESLISHCLEKEKSGRTIYTPSDFGLSSEISYQQLDHFFAGSIGDNTRADAIESIYKLSGLQQGMLFHSLYQAGIGAYINQLSCDLVNADVDVLTHSWQLVLQRHSILRSCFYYDVFTIPVQAVFNQVDVPVTIIDLQNVSANEQDAAILKFKAEDRARGFDFTTPPLMRFTLIRLSANKYRMVLTMHHILIDGWSMPILMEEFLVNYEQLIRGNKVEVKEADHYQDYIRLVERIDKYDEEAYWKNHLKSLDQNTILPFVKTNDRNKGQGAYQTLTLQLNSAAHSQVDIYAKKYHVTLSTIMQGVWAYLLHQYTSNDHVVYGVVVSGRPDELIDVESRVGLYINTLPFHSAMQGDQPVNEWFQALQSEQVSSRQYQHTPLAKIQKWVGVEGDLFDSILVFENYPVNKSIGEKSWSIKVGNVKMEEQTNYPLSIVISSTDKIKINFSYNTELLEAGYVKLISSHFEQALLQLTSSTAPKISDVNILTEEEKQLLYHFNNTAAAYPTNQSITGLFEVQASRTPHAVALVFGEETLSYGQLNNRANQLAHYLQSQGVTKETLVPICLERSIDMIVGLLGIMKAGGAYVPVDPDYPIDRIHFILKDTAATLLVTGGEVADRLHNEFSIEVIKIDGDQPHIDHQPENNLPAIAAGHNLAYIIYTSGSTGIPKGVMIEHTSVVNLAISQIREFGIDESEKILQFSSFAFDASVEQITIALFTGAALILIDKTVLHDPVEISALIKKESITHLHATPGYLEALVPSLGSYPRLKRVVSGGEQCSLTLAEHWGRYVEFYNGYGPTETTIGVIEHKYSSETDIEILPIGKPYANTMVYIVNNKGMLVPEGVTGEIWIGGVNVGRGYLNQPELTKEKFIKDPFSKIPNDRVYRTGDYGRWLPGGIVEYRGRIDNQVKIRGYRIELGEIENILLQSGLVSQAVVVAKTDQNGNKRLVGYVVAEDGFDKEATLAFLENKLPHYMVPALWVQLEKIPLTSNGKVDRRGLPEVDTSGLAKGEYIAPVSDLEKCLADIWQDLLGIERIGLHDNFFELGGDSITTIQVVSRLSRQGYAAQPKDVFLHQSIGRLSGAIADRSLQATSAEQGVLSGNSGLLPIQQRYLNNASVDVSHFNQAILLSIDKKVKTEDLNRIYQQLLQQHDALRFSYSQTISGWQQQYSNHVTQIISEDLSAISATSTLAIEVKERATRHQSSLDIFNGDLVRFVHIQTPAGEMHNRLLMVIHHLAVDGVSWRILLEDLEELISKLVAGQSPVMASKTSSYRQWYLALVNYSKTRTLQSQKKYWQKVVQSYKPLAFNNSNATNLVSGIKSFKSILSKNLTRQLLLDVPGIYHTEINDILLAGLAKTIANHFKTGSVHIGLEGHGREYISNEVDINQTVGWFTTLYPLMVKLQPDLQTGDVIKSVKEQLRQVPVKGLGFGILKYLEKDEKLQGSDPWDIVFNYLGQLDNVVNNSKWFNGANETTGQSRSNAHVVHEKISLGCFIQAGELVVNWHYSSSHISEATIQLLAATYISNLQHIIEHCIHLKNKMVSYNTPADYNLTGEASYEELDQFLNEDVGGHNRRDLVSGIYRLSGLQLGMLFHSYYQQGTAAYINQFQCDLIQPNLQILQQSWQHIVKHHSILRTAFYSDVFSIPVQVVYKDVEMPVEIRDFSMYDPAEQADALKQFAMEDRKRGFDVATSPLMRLTLCKLNNTDYQMLWTSHHLLTDGWSIPILVQEFLTNYESLASARQVETKEEDKYEDYIRFIETINKDDEEANWKTYLAEVEDKTLLPQISATERLNKSGDYKSLYQRICTETTLQVQQFAQKNRLTINTIMQGVHALLLHQYTGNDKVVFGITTSGRPIELKNIDQRVGMYINTLPLLSMYNQDASTIDWLHNIQAGQVSLRQYQYTMLSDIQKWAGIKGEWFDTTLTFSNFPVSEEIVSNQWSLKVKNAVINEQNTFPLSLTIANGKQISVRIMYNTILLQREMIDQLWLHFQQILKQVISGEGGQLEDIRLLSILDEQIL